MSDWTCGHNRLSNYCGACLKTENTRLGEMLNELNGKLLDARALVELADEIIDDLKDKAVEAARGKQVVHIADASELAKKLLAYKALRGKDGG